MARMNLAEAVEESEEQAGDRPMSVGSLHEQLNLRMQIPVDQIALDPVTDVRSGEESQESLMEFAARLDVEGLAQPILVRPPSPLGWPNGPYRIIAGRRRLAAFKLNKKVSIPAYVLDVDDETARRLAFEENFRRKQFSPIDLAKLFLEARDKFTQRAGRSNWSERVANRFGVSRAQVTETIKMYEGLAGEPELLAKVHSGELAADAAMLIAKQKEESGQVFERAQALAVEEAAKKASKTQKAPVRPRKDVEGQKGVEKPVGKAAEGKNTPPKPVKVQAKHVKQAARATGRSAGALNKAEIIDGLLKLVKPGYPAVMSAFLNYAMTDWQLGKGSQEVLANHWLAIACKIEDDMEGCKDTVLQRLGVEVEKEIEKQKAKDGKKAAKATKPTKPAKANKKATKSVKPSQTPRKTAPAKSRKKK